MLLHKILEKKFQYKNRPKRLFRFYKKIDIFLRQYEKNFENAVRVAAIFTGEGEACLLSPACASFDQHKNFEHRGEEFEKIVNSFGDVGG